jgi:2-polyprenyl-6-methoxyphenol hydroxylase-like FAD-dependent oxidoreductase
MNRSILIIGGGIGGLSAAIALRQRGFEVDVVEKETHWAVTGVGILQQSNVVRVMSQLGLLDDYVATGFGFDAVEFFDAGGKPVATVPAPRLVPNYPSMIGIGRIAVNKLLGKHAVSAGADVRLGVTATALNDDGLGVTATFSDGSSARYDLAIGADGIHSATRALVFPDAQPPIQTGQSVWRHNFRRPVELVNLNIFALPNRVGLAPVSQGSMYMFLNTQEPTDRRYGPGELAPAMRAYLKGTCPQIEALSDQITDGDAVNYKPIEWIFLKDDWHNGRIVLLGDAVHATTPHLAQGAGMAVEDSVVLAEELVRHDHPEEAFKAYRARRFERCRYIVETSVAICRGQLGQGPVIDQAKATHNMLQLVSQPI